MKPLLTGLILFVLLSSCKKEANLTTLTGSWKLSAYQSTSIITQREPSDLRQSIILQFLDDGTTGTISGHTVTNSIFGHYQLQPENSIVISQLGGTEVGEPDWGMRFWNSMPKAHSYRVSDKELIILLKPNNEKMIFERQ